MKKLQNITESKAREIYSNIKTLKAFVGAPQNRKLNHKGMIWTDQEFLKDMECGIYIDEPVYVGAGEAMPHTAIFVLKNSEGYKTGFMCAIYNTVKLEEWIKNNI